MLFEYSSPMARRWILFGILPLLAACSGTIAEVPKLRIENVVSSAEPIELGKPFPEFTQYFATGTTVVYTYVWLKNYESMTGSYLVRMRWHHPNDFQPPIMQRTVTLSGQNVAQFSFHSEKGIAVGPYLLDVQAGMDEILFTASGSARFFIGMSEDAANQYLLEEAEFKRKWEENQALQDAEMKKQEDEERARQEKLGWEKRVTGSGEVEGDGFDELGRFDKLGKESSELDESDREVEKSEDDDLPPSLTGGE